jgi:hypothetical protein
MFMFITNQELWTRGLMSHIMGCDNFLRLKEFVKQLNLIYIYIFY